MNWSVKHFAMVAAITMAVPAGPGQAQTLDGAEAQGSPQADAFLAYEGALHSGGLDAARPHMTPAKAAELEGMVQAFGEEGFRQFLERLGSGATGEERRKQIDKLVIEGEHAMLEARDNPNAVTVQYLAKTGEGWKVDVKP